MDFDKLTPSEKLDARLRAWQFPEGTQFKSKEVEQAYQKRVQMLIDVVKLKKPERVPVSISTGFYPFVYAGCSCQDAMYDYEKLGAAMKKFHADFLPDVMATSALYGPGRALEILDYKLYRWPGHGVPTNTPYQCVEDEYMRADEYQNFIKDPTDYFLRYYFPRVFGALDPWKTLPPLTDILELPFTGPTLISFGTPPIQETLKKLMEAGKISFDWLMKCIEIDNDIKTSLGLPTFNGGFSKVPFDTLGDTLRGTTNIMKDMYRCPDKLLKALDVIADISIKNALNSPNIDNTLIFTYPLHKGADGWMSQKQFDKFYWPSLKKLLDALINEGLVQSLFAEGGYNSRLHCVNQFPKGSVAWMFDRTDMAEAKKALGNDCVIIGNVPSSMMVTSDPKDVKEYCRNLIETCKPGGGYILSPGSSTENPKLDNIRAMVEAVNEYGWYK